MGNPAFGTRIPTGARSPDVVTVDRNARMLADAMRRCRRDVSSPITDAHVKNLVKRVECGRVRLHEHFITILHDAFRRGAPREGVEAPARVILAIVANWYEPNQRDDLCTLIRRETAAQAVADVAEMDVYLSQTPKAVADAVMQIDRHLVALEDLSMSLHRRVVQ